MTLIRRTVVTSGTGMFRPWFTTTSGSVLRPEDVYAYANAKQAEPEGPAVPITALDEVLVFRES